MITLVELLERSTKVGICSEEFDGIYECASFGEVLRHEQAESWMRRLWKRESFPEELLPAWCEYERKIYEAQNILCDVLNAAWTAFVGKVGLEEWDTYYSKVHRAEMDRAEVGAAAWAVFAKEVMAILGDE